MHGKSSSSSFFSPYPWNTLERIYISGVALMKRLLISRWDIFGKSMNLNDETVAKTASVIGCKDAATAVDWSKRRCLFYLASFFKSILLIFKKF